MTDKDKTPESVVDVPESVIRPQPEKVQSEAKIPEDNQVGITQTELVPIPQPGAQAAGSNMDKSPILQEFGAPTAQAETEIFEEIPVEVCSQLYKTTLEIGFTLKNKGIPMRELPENRVKTQGEIMYGILKKNQISVAHIDLFMLGAGMMTDWKYMNSMPAPTSEDDENGA